MRVSSSFCCGLPLLALCILVLIGYVMGSSNSAFRQSEEAKLTPEFGEWTVKDDEGFVQSRKESGRWVNDWGKGKR